MNALTAVQNNAVDSGQDYSGFTLIPSAQSPRLLELTFTEQTTNRFLEQVAEWPVQALEYKSFLRFRVGKILDDLCANQLQPLLLKTLLNRAEGALLINAVGIDCLLYTSDAADEGLGVDLGGRRIIKKRSVLRAFRGEKC